MSQVTAVPPDPDRRYSTLKGVGFALCGYFLFATADALTKTIVNSYSSFQIIPMQVVFASLPIVAMIVRGGGFRIPRGVNLALLGLRGLLAGLGAILGLYAFRHLPLADVYALAFCAPLLVTVLAIPILGERVGPRRWAAVIVGFIGILVMVRPGFQALSLGHVAALLTAFSGAGTLLIMRHLRGVETCLSIPGLGGGTFHKRHEPELLGYPEHTPPYEGAMRAYLETLQAHLREQGWLDEAFVYWFDEPDPKDYAFVNNGFAKLKKWAPDLRRMLTEQVEEALVGGPNIWCPLTASYDDKVATERRDKGDAFWWYVCTGPKTPYCTLFIDHPGTELRVWLWQTWQRRITGVLVWQTNYWTSSAAYPDPAHPQNPYADPMGWMSGYSTPPGAVKRGAMGTAGFSIHPSQPPAVVPRRRCWKVPLLRSGWKCCAMVSRTMNTWRSCSDCSLHAARH